MSKVVYLPLDERPCNAKFPQMIAAISDLSLVAPPLELLGRKKQPARYEGVHDWLLQHAVDADYLILSIDMLVYGGIVPSRLHQLSLQACMERLQLLEQLKQRNPALRIYAFNLIMRAPAYNSSDEEPDYYAHYGHSIYRYGWLKDKQTSELLNDDEQNEWLQLHSSIPSAILNDFLQRRETNSQVNEHIITLVQSGIIDHLVIPLDDNSKYGFSPMEQRKLLISVEEYNLMDHVLIYPGADEIGSILFAKVFCTIKKYQPEVFIRYSSTLGPTIIPKYEDRSLNESIKSHLTSGGAFMGDSSMTADFVLMVHSPPVSSNDAAESPNLYRDRHRSYFSEVHIAEFVTAIEAIANKGGMVALADIASCNGADNSLLKLLSKKNLISRLSAYAGWNTSGNTLGTVIAHAIVASYYRQQNNNQESSTQMSEHFMLYRLIEDWGYQTIVRQEVAHHLPELGANYFDVSQVKEHVSQLITQKLQRFCNDYLAELAEGRIDELKADLPWNRMFEVDLSL